MFFNPYHDISTGKLEECHFLAGINNREYLPVFSGQLFQNSIVHDYIEDYKYYTTKTKNGYILEMQLPWDILIDRNLPHAPVIEAGTQIPWDINGCDADDQLVRRDLIAGWSAYWENDWVDNSQYGILELGSDDANAIVQVKKEEIEWFSSSGNRFSFEWRSGLESSHELEVWDIAGNLVFKQKLRNGFNTIDLTNKHSGVYFVRADVGSQCIFKKTVVYR
jgi:hypothetical protein